MLNKLKIPVLLLLLVVLAACGSEPTPEPTPVPEEVATEMPAPNQLEVEADDTETMENTCFDGERQADEYCEGNGVNELVMDSTGEFQFYDPLYDRWFTSNLERINPLRLTGEAGNGSIRVTLRFESISETYYNIVDNNGFIFAVTVNKIDGTATISTGEFPRLRLVTGDLNA